MGVPDAARLVSDPVHRIATLPFDHTRRATSALVDDAGHRRLVVKGAPEQVMANCTTVPAEQQVAQRTLDALFADGRRVVAVAGKPAPDLTAITADDERGLAERPNQRLSRRSCAASRLGLEAP